MIPAYMRPSRRGQTYEVGGAWVWPLATGAKALLTQIGLFVALDQVAGWIFGSFSDPGSAMASGEAVPDATRAYYLGELDNWNGAAAALVSPARLPFVGPVIARAREVIGDPAVSHAEISVTIRAVAQMVEQQAALSGSPMDTADPEIEIVESTWEILDPPPGAVTVPSPGRVAAASVAPGGWALAAGIAVLAAAAWWKYGR